MQGTSFTKKKKKNCSVHCIWRGKCNTVILLVNSFITEYKWVAARYRSGENLTLQAAHHTSAWREATKLNIRILIKYKRAERLSAFQDRFRPTELTQTDETRETNHQINVTYFGYILRSGNGHNWRQIHEKSTTTINGVTIMLLTINYKVLFSYPYI
jgi:hypothetical protein